MTENMVARDGIAQHNKGLPLPVVGLFLNHRMDLAAWGLGWTVARIP